MRLKLFDFGFMICMKKPELVIIDMYDMTEYRAGRHHVAILHDLIIDYIVKYEISYLHTSVCERESNEENKCIMRS